MYQIQFPMLFGEMSRKTYDVVWRLALITQVQEAILMDEILYLRKKIVQ